MYFSTSIKWCSGPLYIVTEGTVCLVRAQKARSVALLKSVPAGERWHGFCYIINPTFFLLNIAGRIYRTSFLPCLLNIAISIFYVHSTCACKTCTHGHLPCIFACWAAQLLKTHCIAVGLQWLCRFCKPVMVMTLCRHFQLRFQQMGIEWATNGLLGHQHSFVGNTCFILIHRQCCRGSGKQCLAIFSSRTALRRLSHSLPRIASPH